MFEFKEWTCIFPGKMGISWKRAWDGVGTKEEAEEQAKKNCNVIAIPLQLFENIKRQERSLVIAMKKLNEVGYCQSIHDNDVWLKIHGVLSRGEGEPVCDNE